MSGMMGLALAEDLAVVNNTLSTWSARSVRMILYYFPLSPPHHPHNHAYSPNLGSAYAPLVLKSVFPSSSIRTKKERTPPL
jgi:hypothetical protein